MLPVIFGLHGPELTADERALFRGADPAGYILFRRNIADADQVRRLTGALRAIHGRDALPILIDQEGGRVARLQPPEWPAFPRGADFGRLYDVSAVSAMEAARHNARLLAIMLAGLGITVDCLPVLDVPVPGAHDIIGDRAYGQEPMRVAALGRATLDGLRDGGCVGVVKHVPGHGRAATDSHLDLPVVTASAAALEQDLEPFIKLADAPMAMTAHVIYTAWDRELCASLSPTIIADVIRGRIGFDGLLMSDDLGMHALGKQPGGNDMAARALGVLAAGCDVALHCSGDFAEMRAITEAAPAISPRATERLARAMAWAANPNPYDVAALTRDRDALLALA